VSDEDLFDQAADAAADQGQEADDFLMAEGTPSASFPTIGTVVQGVILGKKVTNQTEFGTGKTKTYDDGNVARQLVVTVQTDLREDIVDTKSGKVKRTAADDDGKRAVYVKGQLKAAVRDAVREAGARGLEIGGTLAVKFTDTKPSGKGNPIKVYTVKYRSPGQPATTKAAGGTMSQIKAAAKAEAEQAAADDPGF
jgi:hypothetical protein